MMQRALFSLVLAAAVLAEDDVIPSPAPARPPPFDRLLHTPEMFRDSTWIDRFLADAKPIDGHFRVPRARDRLSLRGNWQLPAPAAGKVLRLQIDPWKLGSVMFELDAGKKRYRLKMGDDPHNHHLVAYEMRIGEAGKEVWDRRCDDEGQWAHVKNGRIDFRWQAPWLVVARSEFELMRLRLAAAPNYMRMTLRSAPLLDYGFFEAAPLELAAEPARMEWTDPGWRVPVSQRHATTNGWRWATTNGTLHMSYEPMFREHRQVVTPMPSNRCFSSTFEVLDAGAFPGLIVRNAGGAELTVFLSERDGYVVPTTDPWNPKSMAKSKYGGFQYKLPFRCRLSNRGGSLRAEFSQHGTHWTMFEEREVGNDWPRREPVVGASFHPPRTSNKRAPGPRLVLRPVSTRTWTWFDKLAELAPVERVPALNVRDGNYTKRLDELREQGPAEVEPAVWRLACSLAFTRRATSSEAMRRIGGTVLRDAVDANLPVDAVAEAMREFAAAQPTWKRHGSWSAIEFEPVIERLGQRILLRDEMDAMPVWCGLWQQYPFDVPRRRSHRHMPAVVQAWWFRLREAGAHEELARATARYQHYLRPGKENRLGAWLHHGAMRALGREVPSVANESWEIGVSVPSDREARNRIQDFRVALAEADFLRAARLLLEPAQRDPFVQVPGDPGLHMRASRILHELTASQPAFVTHLTGEPARLAELRMQRLIAAGRWSELEIAARRLATVPAAARAWTLLADRDLSAGEFGRAAERYHRALAEAPATTRGSWHALPGDERNPVAARRDVALRLGGRPARLDWDGEITWPGGAVAAAELKDLMGGAAVAVDSGPKPRFEPFDGGDVAWEQLPGVKLEQSPVFTFAPVAQGLLVVMERSTQLLRGDGSVAWRREFDRDQKARRRQVVAIGPGRFAVVLDVRDGHALQVRETDSGEVAWTRRLRDFPQGDALFLGNRVLVPVRSSDSALRLEGFGQLGGDPLGSEALCGYRPVSSAQAWCRSLVTPSGRAVFSGYGLLFGTDPAGRVAWIRELTDMVPYHASIGMTRWSPRRMLARAADGTPEHVLASPPGCPELLRLDVFSGRIQSRHPVPNRIDLMEAGDGRWLVRQRGMWTSEEWRIEVGRESGWIADGAVGLMLELDERGHHLYRVLRQSGELLHEGRLTFPNKNRRCMGIVPMAFGLLLITAEGTEPDENTRYSLLRVKS